jgi:hypothetical protein
MPSTQPSLGFLTALEDDEGGYLGGYLITNYLGRPLEFQCTTPIRPNRPQRILYGSTLRPYLMGELIGLTLVEKAATKADLLFTDQEPILALRPHLTAPLACLDRGFVAGSDGAVAFAESPPGATVGLSNRAREDVSPATNAPFAVHWQFDADRSAIEAWLTSLETPLDLIEPFSRIREAVDEALQSSSLR